MNGRFLIEIKFKKKLYKLDLKNKITCITDNSGTGKTYLLRLIATYLKQPSLANVQITHYYNNTVIDNDINYGLKVLSGSSWETVLRHDESYKNKIIFIDEDIEVHKSNCFNELIKSNYPSYFVIINRSAYLFKSLSISVDAIKVMYYNEFNNYYELVNKYYDGWVYNYNNVIPDELEYIITEDRNSGNRFFKSIYDIDCIPAKGKGNICTFIREYNKYNIMIVIDKCAFGCHIDECLELALRYNVIVFSPPCFERLLLEHDMFNKFVDLNDILHNPSNYIVSPEEEYWYNLLKFYTYSLNLYYNNNLSYTKNTLPNKFITQSFSNKVKNMLLTQEPNSLNTEETNLF